MNAVNVSDNIIYDFSNELNQAKWKGILTASLRKVSEAVHPSLRAQEDALEYVETLCLQLLAKLCAKPSPHTVQEVEYRVSNFPKPIDEWALNEAREALERGKKKSTLLLPLDKIHSLLQKELLMYKVDFTVSLFLVAVLEYVSADIFKLAGNYVNYFERVEITCQDVQISMNADEALLKMFNQKGNNSGILSEPQVVLTAAPRTSLTYEEVVRELIASEKTYMRELHMIIKVFREEMMKLSPDQKEIDMIFSNIMDLYELTYTLSGSLEDVIEMAQEQMPYIGSCFEELAEAEEFQAYSKYAKDVTSSRCRETLNQILSRPEVEGSLLSAGQGMRLALKYYLPALLMGPIRHCYSYMEYIRILKELSHAEDKESLEQVEVMLKPLQIELGRCVPPSAVPRTSASPLVQTRARRQAALEKIQELEKSVENWDACDVGQCCNEFVREDFLMKVSAGGKRLTERRVFLFDGLMMLCKKGTKRHHYYHHHHHHHHHHHGGVASAVASAALLPNSVKEAALHLQQQQQPIVEYRLKERFFMRKMEIVDQKDTEELKYSFEICPRQQQQSVLLCAKSQDEKNSWMADLVMLNNRSILERILDSILADIERKHPLKLPSPELYRFAEPDSKDNIVLEQRENGGVPLIKGATLYKLVERLTYHIYADPKFVRTFLTTYRSFCSPQELLDLLVERFKIPDPSLVYAQDGCHCGCPETGEKMQKCTQREDWKKYRKEYCQPVQFRVLNVLRHWVDHHFYDFEREPELLCNLEKFLDSVNGKSMRKWVDSVLKIVQRKMENDSQRHIKFAFDENPPPIERHLEFTDDELEKYAILVLHPVEIARQLTILEFDLYRTIKPSELVGSVWTKKDKEKTSPNLLKMIKHTTNFTLWLEKNIVDADNFEERVAIYNRIIEIMIALNEINNFNGVLAVVSATASASIHRLKLTYQALSQQKQKALEECRSDDHFKKYQEKLRSINPPCVPFLGMYLTNILHIEEGNPDHLPSATQLINFFKRRKVAEITGEIQQYQNQPYVFTIEPKIRHFLENLSPFGDLSENEINNYLYNKSIEIEPRGSRQIIRFPRKWQHLNLKSPGIKTTSKAATSSSSASSSSSSGAANAALIHQQQQNNNNSTAVTTTTSTLKQLINSTTSLASASTHAAVVATTTMDASKNSSSSNNEESKSEDSSRSDNDFSVFASVQLGGGGTAQNSPSSPISPSWRSSTSTISSSHHHHHHHHVRSPSSCSSTSTIVQTSNTFRHARTNSINNNDIACGNGGGGGGSRNCSMGAASSVTPNSPGPRSPGIFCCPSSISPNFESGGGVQPNNSQQGCCAVGTPPPIPPRRRRDSPEISSPQQMKQAPDAPLLPPRECSPPPLPPRRGDASSTGGPSPSAFGSPGAVSSSSTTTLSSSSSFVAITPPPRLHPTHASQLHMRRKSQQQQQQRTKSGGGGGGGGNVVRTTSFMPPPPPPPSSSILNGGLSTSSSLLSQSVVPATSTPLPPSSASPRFHQPSSPGCVVSMTTPKLPPKPSSVSSSSSCASTRFQYPTT